MSSNLTWVQRTVWEEIARRQISDELPPSVRELQAVTGQSSSVIHYTLDKLERDGLILCPRLGTGKRIARTVQIRIWPASFGIGLNEGG